MDENEEIQVDDSLESRKMQMQAYYKSGQRVNRGEFIRQRMYQQTQKMVQDGQKNASEKLKNSNISKPDFYFVLATAAFFDGLAFLINLIPILGGIVSSVLITPVATLTLYILYLKRGIPIKLLKFGGTSLAEFIPVLNAAPIFMANVLLNYPSVVSKTLDKLPLKK